MYTTLNVMLKPYDLTIKSLICESVYVAFLSLYEGKMYIKHALKLTSTYYQAHVEIVYDPS